MGASLTKCLRQEPQGWSRPAGIIHKSTFAVRNAQESADFCVKYLQCEHLPCHDTALVTRGVRWVRLSGGTHDYPAGEFHFIPSTDADLNLTGGVDLNGDGRVEGAEMRKLTQEWFKGLVDAADQDMQIWTVYANTHIAFCVDDLTPTILALQREGVPFFGPTLREDGVFQLYIQVPYLHYVEVDSTTYDAVATGRPARPWSQIMKESKKVLE